MTATGSMTMDLDFAEKKAMPEIFKDMVNQLQLKIEQIKTRFSEKSKGTAKQDNGK